MFGIRSPGKVDIAAKALATACGVAHATFFGIFAWRVIGRDGIGTFAWMALAATALLGLGVNFIGYYLIKNGGRSPARRWGYWAIAASSALAGVLLGIASMTSGG
jgi:hypothetical protein